VLGGIGGRFSEEEVEEEAAGEGEPADESTKLGAMGLNVGAFFLGSNTGGGAVVYLWNTGVVVVGDDDVVAARELLLLLLL
jgi:hypothetical protein